MQEDLLAECGVIADRIVYPFQCLSQTVMPVSRSMDGPVYWRRDVTYADFCNTSALQLADRTGTALKYPVYHYIVSNAHSYTAR